MALKGPTPEDLRKIHAEVNQLVNQRFLLTTLAISVLGVVLAWIVPRTPPARGSPIGGFPIASAVLLLFLLFLLYLLSHQLRGMLRLYTAYLIATGKSGLEDDLETYRKKYPKEWFYTKPQSVVFMVLGVLAALSPVLLGLFFSLAWSPMCGLVGLGILWVLYELLVWRMAFKNLWSTDKFAGKRWEGLKSERGP